MGNFNGKAIYNPAGKAGEYAEWACNFYVGCSNGCEYCYCKKGRSIKWLGGDTPTLKKCFRDEDHALEVFQKELAANLDELRKHGLFFSFTTDPMLRETQTLTMNAAGIALNSGVPVKILTKCASWVKNWIWWFNNSNSDNAAKEWRNLIAIGFTLTGHDELEPNTSPNAERIEAMRNLHAAGFKTFASIEPIIDVADSLDMMAETQGFCDLYKVGLMSGKKYPKTDIWYLISELSKFAQTRRNIYIKDSVLKAVKMNRAELPDYFVNRDHNLFAIK